VEFFARIVVTATDLKLADIAGTAAAFVSWPVLRRLPGGLSLLSIALAALIVLLRLAPFHLQPLSRPFVWVPFSSMFHGSAGVAIQVFLEKSYLYGGLIWLSNRAGLTLGATTMLVTLLLAVTGYAETWLPGRSAEITDAVIALGIGGMFHLFPGRSASRSVVHSR
jgi:hypothetical protein